MRPGMQAGGDEPAASGANGSSSSCPLCEGRESETPPEVYAIRASGLPDSPGWMVRAVPNKYPLLAPERGVEATDPLEHGRGEPDLLASGSANGAHEVIVHAPEHHLSLADLEPDQFSAAIQAWRARISAHDDAPYVHLSVNEGRRAGASLEHTHAQLYALPFVPALVARERERFTAHNTRTMGGCLLCDVLQEEVRRRERVIAVDDDAVVLAPYASRTPFEVQLVPRRHERSFIESDLRPAALLQDALLRLRRVLGGSPPPLNLWVRSAPKDAGHFHWHIDVIPRTTQLAGLELGTGVAVNVCAPEQAAAELRDAAAG
jgi:UDPglucose--hexose-1-phosphate uridylyltransferase